MVEMRANLQPRISTAQTPRLGDGGRRGASPDEGEACLGDGGRRGASPDKGEACLAPTLCDE